GRGSGAGTGAGTGRTGGGLAAQPASSNTIPSFRAFRKARLESINRVPYGKTLIGEKAMAKKYDVAALGNAIVDIIASVDDRFLLTHRIAKGGMTLIDEFRAKDLLKSLADNRQALSGLHEIAGGSAANTMAGLASLGGKGLFVGKVFDDRLG